VFFFSNTKLLIFGNFYFIIRKSLNSFYNLNSNDESLSEDSKIKLITKRVKGTEKGYENRKKHFDSIKKAINYDKNKCPTI